MKNFKQEIIKFHSRLVSGQNFAFSKYADGEWLAMNNMACQPGNGEWSIDNRSNLARHLLIESFQYKDPDYYVGISCPCCQGNAHYEMEKFSGQDQEHLTFANIFVNSNYPLFIEYILPELIKRDNTILVANRNSNLNNLPFKVEEFFGIGYNAWVEDLALIEILIEKNYKDKLILFSAGPFGNILAYKLWSNNKNNTYIDIGSTIDLWLNNDLKNKRGYAINVKQYSEKECVWGNYE
jgi:hypothetical protein